MVGILRGVRCIFTRFAGAFQRNCDRPHSVSTGKVSFLVDPDRSDRSQIDSRFSALAVLFFLDVNFPVRILDNLFAGLKMRD